MSDKKRGGARLEKAKPTKKKTPASVPASAKDPAPQKRPPLPHKGLRIAILVLAAISAVFLILFAVYKSWAKLPDLPTPPPAETPSTDPNGDVTSSTPQPVLSDRKKEFYTFLVVGKDTVSGSTDTIMLAAYDIPNQKLTVMSIPRDTMVNARHPGKNRKINAVWNLGLYYAEKGSEKKGIDYLREALGDMLGFNPDCYVIVNWKAFGRLVDAIGGVDFNVPFTMQYKDPTQDLVIYQPAGQRHLTGEDAMQIVRWRHDNYYTTQYADGDLGRIRTQQALLKEIVKKCLKIENVTRINEFAEIFTEEVETDLTVGNLAAFAERAILGGLDMDNVNFTTMPVEGVYVGAASYVQAKPEELLGLVNDSLNPYLDDLTMENLDILQYSKENGYYTYKGTGTGTPYVSSTPSPIRVQTKPSPSASPTPSAASAAGSASPAPSATHTGSTPKPSNGRSPSPGVSGEPDTPPREDPTEAPEVSPGPSEESIPAAETSPDSGEEPGGGPTSQPGSEPSELPEPTPSEPPETTPEPTPGDAPEGIPLD